MGRNEVKLVPNLSIDLPTNSAAGFEPLEWDWDAEHADRKLEAKRDAALHGATPFQVDRKLLKDIVREKTCVEVARIKFMSAGTFHKAYLITLADHTELVARVARRFMPRLKTESEVATMQYIREKTNIPVPVVYHYDSNPYNRLGGEWILMSKAKGVPLSTVWHSLGYSDLKKLVTNMIDLFLPLFAHRFSKLGSLYFGPDPEAIVSGIVGSLAPTPKAVQMHYSAFPFSPTLPSSDFTPKGPSSDHEFHVGPIISWPFFGTNRGEMIHPTEINRGPWSSTHAYFESCVEREITGVKNENEGKAAPHKLHLDPDEILSSRHHHTKAVPGDESDDSDEWDLEESEDEEEGPGDLMYRDYRRMQRGTFLIAHMHQREDCVKREMERWLRLMEKLSAQVGYRKEDERREEFGLDCHDLSLENVFVDPVERWKITCIIDWESTTTRPLWACAHLPAFLQTSPFTARLFRETVIQLSSNSASAIPIPQPFALLPKTPRFRSPELDIPALAREWLYEEASGAKLRLAHRVVEWDGWEEGLVDSIIGTEDCEEDWFTDVTSQEMMSPSLLESSPPSASHQASKGKKGRRNGHVNGNSLLPASISKMKIASKIPLSGEILKEKVLDTTGDICGGRGGELGVRLEAWLTAEEENGANGFSGRLKRWTGPDQDEGDEADVE